MSSHIYDDESGAEPAILTTLQETAEYSEAHPEARPLIEVETDRRDKHRALRCEIQKLDALACNFLKVTSHRDIVMLAARLFECTEECEKLVKAVLVEELDAAFTAAGVTIRDNTVRSTVIE